MSMHVTTVSGFIGPPNNSAAIAVANSVVQVIDSLIPGIPPFGEREIHVIFGSQPRVCWNEEDHNGSKYRIIVSSQAPYWQQLAYQLLHELAHIKMGPARSNLLVEVFAAAASLEGLSRIKDVWCTSPP